MNQPLGWGAGVGVVVLTRYPASKVRIASRLHTEVHGSGHTDGIARTSDGRVHQYTIAAQLHRDGCVGSSAQTRIHQNGDLALVNDEA